MNYKGQACITNSSTPTAAIYQQGALVFSTSTNYPVHPDVMNNLHLPVGYKPTNTDQIRTYCHGNNGYFVKNSATIVNYDWRTDDGVLYEKHDGTNCGVTQHNTNIFSDSMGSVGG